LVVSDAMSSRPSLSRREALAFSVGIAGAGALAGCRAGPTTYARAEDERAELDELFPDLSDRRGDCQPISAAERAARRTRLGSLLAKAGLDAYFCEGGATMTYLAGTSWGRSERAFALAVLADGSHFWICPAFEAEKARLAIEAPDGPGGAIVTWDEHEYAWKPFAAALKSRRAERVAVDPGTRCFLAERLRRELGSERVVLGDEVVVGLRGVKDAHELELLRKSNELTQLAIAAVARTVEPGMTGSDVSARMAAAHRKLGMSGPWCLALVGPAAAYPHGENHAVRIGRGDFLLVDTGASYHGYQSDNTRTWTVAGEPGEKQVRAWNAVRDAQRRAFDAIRPGVACREIDRIARDAIAAAGFGSGYQALTHRLGHGIGLEGHEDPYFDGGSEVRLEPGMTLSNEPGVYLYGELGVRLEDIVVVTASGADHFGEWQPSPRSPC
jgi:Xaa-Pro dipeptidase